MSSGYDAVLLLGFGGPEGVEEVVPFLERVTAGRGIPGERLVEVGQHYFALGGVSPLNGQNRALRAALAEALAKALPEPVEVLLANRNSPPFVADVLSQLADSGRGRILAVATAAYSGYSSCRQYREDLGGAAKGTGLEAGVRKLAPFYDLPEFASTITALLLEALPADLPLADEGTRLVFTTHSVPTAMAGSVLSNAVPSEDVPGGMSCKATAGGDSGSYATSCGRGRSPDPVRRSRDMIVQQAPDSAGPDGDGYLAQHRWVAARVAEGIAKATGITKEWDLVFQSRSGPPTMPWLEPDVNDALREYAAGGTTAVVLVPIGFLSDHMEVIWDLDTQARQTAEELGLRLIRTPTVGTDPRFVDALAARIAAELAAPSAEPGPGDFCFGACCANPRRELVTVPGTGRRR